MNHPRQLETIASDEFENRFSQISTSEGLYRALRRSIEVKSLNSAIREELISESQIDAFVRDLIRSFVPGEQFASQIALAAVAAACENINKAFARQFIEFLSGMDSIEFSCTTAVARLASKSISSTITKTFGSDFRRNEVRLLDKSYRSEVGQYAQTYGWELV